MNLQRKPLQISGDGKMVKNDEVDERPADPERMVFSGTLIMQGLLVVLMLVTAFNQYQIATLAGMEINPVVQISIAGLTAADSQGAATNADSTRLSGANSNAAQVDILPRGVPTIYGEELGVSYDDVSASNAALADSTIRKLGALDDQLTLSGDALDRYIKIGSAISCEYCCGAEAIIFSNGQAACGCAHSYAMRGVAKYLLLNHPDEFSDIQILEELGKWKVLFFPQIHEQKARALLANDIELNYVNLASNLYRGIENGATSSAGSGSAMVGGC